MKVLLVGSGGREHALAWKLKQSRLLDQLIIAPGNPGTGSLGKNVPVSVGDIPELVALAKTEGVDLVFVGPEAPIAAGLVNRLEKLNIPVFAPRREAAMLEASKVWAKSFMKRHRIPTADFEVFSDFDEAKEYTYSHCEYPCVIKADGLAGGKGVSVVKSKSEALKALDALMIRKRFGPAGKRVLVEDFLQGRELSVFVVSDGYSHRLLGWASDYKPLLDQDQGPNTGGMGTVSPVPFLKKDDLSIIEEKVIAPTFQGLRNEGMLYKGILYFGLMWTQDGPYLLEYNVRMGDPEAQAILPLLKTDLLELAVASANEKLAGLEIELDQGSSCCVVLASEGYPLSPVVNRPITGLDQVQNMENVLVFHAGTKTEGSKLLTAGGRVLAVVGLGKDMSEARQRAYQAVSEISFEGMHYRTDIGDPARFGL